jgi:hypothetical protein
MEELKSLNKMALRQSIARRFFLRFPYPSATKLGEVIYYLHTK